MRVLQSTFASARQAIRQIVQRQKLAHPRAADTLVRSAFYNLRPLKVASVTSPRPYVTMVTDTVAPAQLLGGVGTAVLLAASIAIRGGWGLRIVTREFRCDDAAIRTLLALQGVRFDGQIDLIFSDGSPNADSVPLGPEDRILTTSWWGTWSVRQTVPAHQIIYLLQEDERMFYPGGDQQLLCDDILNYTGIRYVVNSSLLMRHFIQTETSGPATNGISFEPAFPKDLYYPEAHGPKYNLVFYARPGHPRNLFLRGVEVLRSAFNSGLFPVDLWDVHFFGVDVPNVIFADRPIKIHNSLPWAKYAQLIRQADLGLSLMYTPHPSYPPLDLAASGAVAVTNRFGPKGSTAHYSNNILYSPLSEGAMLDALRRGAELAVDAPTRKAAYESASLNRQWQSAFAPVLSWLESHDISAVSVL